MPTTPTLPKPTLPKAHLEALQQALLAKRKELIHVIEASISPLPSDDERSEPEEVAQRATEGTQERGISDSERQVLARVDHALAKFPLGTYGVSEKSGAPIPYPRLQAVPWAQRCVDE